MELQLINRLAMIGVAFVGIGNMLFSTDKNTHEIQEQVFMDMYDFCTLEKEVEERRKNFQHEFEYKGYKIVLK